MNFHDFFHELVQFSMTLRLAVNFQTFSKHKQKNTVFPDFSRLTIEFYDWLSRPEDEILIFHDWDTEIFYNSYELCLQNSVNYLLSLVFLLTLLYVNNLPNGWETLNVGSWTELKALKVINS